MFTFSHVRKSAALAIAVVTVALGTGCSTSHRTSALPQTHLLNGYDEFETAGDRAPSAKTLYRLGMLLASQGKFQQAEAVMMSSIEQYPAFSPAYSELAQLQMRTSRIDQAILTLEAGVKAQPNDPVLHNNLGLCLIINEEQQLAYDEFNKAWSMAPENKRYAANAALALGMLGRTDEARTVYESVMSKGSAMHNISVINSALGIDTQISSEYANTDSNSDDNTTSTSDKTAGVTNSDSN